MGNQVRTKPSWLNRNSLRAGRKLLEFAPSFMHFVNCRGFCGGQDSFAVRIDLAIEFTLVSGTLMAVEDHPTQSALPSKEGSPASKRRRRLVLTNHNLVVRDSCRARRDLVSRPAPAKENWCARTPRSVYSVGLLRLAKGENCLFAWRVWTANVDTVNRPGDGN